jgi:hypothetical protein
MSLSHVIVSSCSTGLYLGFSRLALTVWRSKLSRPPFIGHSKRGLAPCVSGPTAKGYRYAQ